MNDNNTEKKRGRGRPAGAANKEATIRVPLADLVALLATTAMVPVKRSFALEILGIEETEEEVPIAPTKPVKAPVAAPKKAEEEEDEDAPLPMIRRAPSADD